MIRCAAMFGLLSVAVMVACGFVQPADSPATVPAPATSKATILTPPIDVHVVADNLVAPWAITFLPDGRVMFTERAGRVRIIKDGVLQPDPALVVSDIKAWLKMGLLGLVLDPQFQTNRHIYLAECYGGEAERDSWVRIVRYTLEGEKLVSPTTLLDRIPAFWNHSGGRLAFGPDGKLYITTGDSDRPPLSQDLKSLAGKILRINPDGSIPSDNPFANDPAALPVIWSYGHRNPQGLAFDRNGRLYAPEHGPEHGDEINIIQPGKNYGWPTVSHDRRADGMTPSLAEFTPAIGPADATFYHGAMFPEFEGDLLVGCMRGESVLHITLDTSGAKIDHMERLLHRTIGRIREVAVAPDGAIWISTSENDPPDGRGKPDYDQVIRLSRGSGEARGNPVRPIGGVALYAAHCAECHGTPTRAGDSTSLFDRQWEFGANDNAIRRNIEEGVAKMKGFKSILSADEINEIVRYVRSREQLYGPRN